MKPIVLHSEAETEFDETIAWYERRREGLGVELKAEVEAVLKGIRDGTLSGTQYPQTNQRFVLVPRFPYLVCFLELDTVIWIPAIAHERREPGYWSERAPEN